MFKPSKRLNELPAYLFAEIDRIKRKAKAESRDIIDLGVGDPDQPTPRHIIEKLCTSVQDPATHKYALDQGMPALRCAIADWYKSRFHVGLNPETEILPLIGSKEGLSHFPLAFLNPADYALVPDPCYPPYKSGVILAGGRLYLMPLLESNAFLPDFKKIPLNIRKIAKIMFINYPNNPTAATADKDFYSKVIEFASKYKIILVSDLAYSEISYDGYRPCSLLEIEGAKEIAVEFHSLSKTYNMTGWRIGWVSGNAKAISALAKVKSNIDSGIFPAIQLAGISALTGSQQHLQDICQQYQERRDVLIQGLNSLGWDVIVPKATFYVWLKIPRKVDSLTFSHLLLEETDIVVTPGVGFGQYGEGYIRMSLTLSVEKIHQAVERLKNKSRHFHRVGNSGIYIW